MYILVKSAMMLLAKSPKFNLPKGAIIQDQEKEKLSIQYDPNKVDLADILESLVKAGVSIKDISTTQADLEEVFKFLVNK